MAKYVIEDTTLTGIADAIRGKTGGADPIPVTDMAAEIAAITAGGTSGGSSGGSVEGIVYVTFMNGDVEICKTACMVGDSTVDPVEDGKIAVPTKDPSVSTVYTYAGGWSLTDGGASDEMVLVDVTEDRTVYAVYNESVREYTINFYDGETLLESLSVPYGEVPSPTTAPEKAGYVLAGWEPVLVPVTEDAAYVAVWEDASVILSSGSCGTSATYILKNTGVLTISGTGAITSSPWKTDYSGIITSVVIDNGITSIGAEYAFNNCSALTSVTMPASLYIIQRYAFNNCSALTSVTIPAGVTTIYPGAFYGCSDLKSAIFEDTSTWYWGNMLGAYTEQIDVTDPSTAATYLVDTYKYKYWNKG